MQVMITNFTTNEILAVLFKGIIIFAENSKNEEKDIEEISEADMVRKCRLLKTESFLYTEQEFKKN